MSSRDSVIEQERKTPVAIHKDVVVVGGGPAGLVAAIAAARNGADTILIEKHGFLGGMATAGMVANFMTFFAGENQIIRGIPEELVSRLVAAGASEGHSQSPLGRSGALIDKVQFEPEMLKCIADELILESGAGVLFHSWMVGVLKEGNNCQGVFIENKSGRQAILGKVIVDATGDGDVAVKAGVLFEEGEAKNGQLQPVTLMFRLSNVDLRTLYSLSYEERNRIIEEGCAKKEIPVDRFMPIHLPTYNPGAIILNITRIGGVDATNAEALSQAEIEGRRQVLRIVSFLKRNMPGLGNSFLSGIAPQIGVRETRRICGEYTLTGEDVLKSRNFEDNIARAAYPIEFHDPKGAGVTHQFPEQGASYEIPYRCLLPRDVDYLLVAGRPVSATREAHAAIRVQATCMAMGQAAGTAAALAVKSGVTPRKISLELLRNTLKEQGAVL